MNSATYQRSSKPLAGNEADDRFYSHYLVRRLPAEVILDAYSAGDRRADAVQPDQRRQAGDGRDAMATTRSARGPCNCPTRWCVSRFLDAFGRPERDADLFVRAASRTPASARRCTSTTADAQRQAAGQELDRVEVAGG